MKAKVNKSQSLPALHGSKRAAAHGGGGRGAPGVPVPRGAAARPRMPQPHFDDADEFQHWHRAHEESKMPGAKRSPRLLDPIDTGVAGGGGGGGGGRGGGGGPPPAHSVGIEGSHYASATVTGLADQSDAAVPVKMCRRRREGVACALVLAWFSFCRRSSPFSSL